MEMEMEVKDELGLALERLSAAATALEQAADRFAGIELQASLDRVQIGVTAREAQLEDQLAEAQATIASLRADGGKLAHQSARRTTSGAITSLLAKHGEPVESGALDAALRSLSLEQRIAVKSEMMRAGLLG